MQRYAQPVVLLLALLSTGATPGASAQDSPRTVGDPAFAGAALAAVDAYHRLDVEDLKPRLGEDFRFVERKMGQDLDGPGFLAMVSASAGEYRDREVDIRWAGVMPSGEDAAEVEVRGRWRATEAESGRALDLAFSSRLDLRKAPAGGDREPSVRIVSWTDVFERGRLFLPVRGDGRHSSDHFDVRYLSAEFGAESAARLAALAETWYERTAAFLGRRLESGRRVLFDVASVHEIPYASAPGPGAFFLVSVESAERKYGFSLVHELTHNLMGLSQLSRSTFSENGDGNRLFDEGFGVYVEERLVEGGRVYPNFGREIHDAYLSLHERLEVPRPPVLEAERLRNQGGDRRRLGYLQQASFVKWLVDEAPGPQADDGLERFLELFERGLDALPELYGRDLALLEEDWLAFLDRFAGADPPVTPGHR